MPAACWPILAPRSSRSKGPARLDVSRGGAFSGVYPDNQPGDDPWNRTSTFNLLNRGKKSLALDLRRPEGREVLKDLIKVSDVLMENFTPRVMRGWELDYPNATKLNPNVIMVSCSGYGPHGPYAQYPAQATTQEATHGLAHVTGYRGDVPSKAGQSFVDFLATWALVMGTTLALRYRNRFGKGLWVDVAMYQLGCYMVADRILDWEANKRLGERIGNRHPWLAPQGCYRCAGDDAVVRGFGARRRGMGGAMPGDRPAGTGARCAVRQQRRAHDATMMRSTRSSPRGWQGSRRRRRWSACRHAGVRAGAVFDARDMHLDPHAKARGLLETVQFPPERGIGKRVIIGRPWRLSRTPLAHAGARRRRSGSTTARCCKAFWATTTRAMRRWSSPASSARSPTAMRPILRMSMEERVRQGRLAVLGSGLQGAAGHSGLSFGNAQELTNRRWSRG